MQMTPSKLWTRSSYSTELVATFCVTVKFAPPLRWLTFNFNVVTRLISSDHVFHQTYPTPEAFHIVSVVSAFVHLTTAVIQILLRSGAFPKCQELHDTQFLLCQPLQLVPELPGDGWIESLSLLSSQWKHFLRWCCSSIGIIFNRSTVFFKTFPPLARCRIF